MALLDLDQISDEGLLELHIDVQQERHRRASQLPADHHYTESPNMGWPGKHAKARDIPKGDERQKTAVALLVAESEFLKAHGWLPCPPASSGGQVTWTDGKGTQVSQDSAVIIQRGRNV
jgi:hypothetical protein